MNPSSLPLLLCAAAAWAFSACLSPSSPKPPAASADPAAQIERGRYLVTVAGCNDCHSPKRPGPNGPEIIAERMLSGYPADLPLPAFDSKLFSQGYAMFTPDLTAAQGPWGISFAANLTPHETGLGNWSLEQFARALREGKSKGLAGSRALLPPMPWVNYVGMSDEDVAAMFAYLRSIPPVDNLVPAPVPPAAM